MEDLNSKGYIKENIDLSGDLVIFESDYASLSYTLKEQRKIIKEWAKNYLVGKQIYLPNTGMHVLFSSQGVKEAINQPHRNILQKNELIRNIEDALITAEFVKSETDSTGDQNFIYHYFRTVIKEEDSYIVLREVKKEGKIYFYSIVDKLKNDPGPR